MEIHYDSQRAEFHLDRDSSFFNVAQLDVCAIIKHSERFLPEIDDLNNYWNWIIASKTADWYCTKQKYYFYSHPLLTVNQIRAIFWPEKMLEKAAILYYSLSLIIWYFDTALASTVSKIFHLHIYPEAGLLDHMVVMF